MTHQGVRRGLQSIRGGAPASQGGRIPGAQAFSRASDSIYTTLKSELYLTLPPGARLTEGTLSERFGVSRIPVREALQQLVREGFLEAHFRNGYTVTGANQRQADELNHLRALFEREAVFFIVRSTEEFPELDALWNTWNCDIDRDALSPSDLSAMNFEFHSTIVSCSRNSELVKLHQSVFERIEVTQRVDFTNCERIESTFREHLSILESLRAKDLDGALERLLLHLESSNRFVQITVQMMGQEPPTTCTTKIRHQRDCDGLQR